MYLVNECKLGRFFPKPRSSCKACQFRIAYARSSTLRTGMVEDRKLAPGFAQEASAKSVGLTTLLVNGVRRNSRMES